MRSFSDRTQTASELETPFIDILNQECETHKIAKFGVENTGISELHQYIRFATDLSSRFVRFLPDSVMVRTNNNGIGAKTALIEFKVQDTLIYSDNFFQGIQREYEETKQPDDPILDAKDQIFNIEKDALDIYTRIASLGVIVIVIGWQKPTRRLVAQYADKIVICNDFIGDRERRTSGSGTPNYNTHIDSYESLDAFFSREFRIQDHVLNVIMQSIRV